MLFSAGASASPKLFDIYPKPLVTAIPSFAHATMHRNEQAPRSYSRLPYRVSLALGALALTAVLICMGASRARAGGYYVAEQGSRAMSLSGAVTAFNPSVSTLMHNPAGLAHLRGTHFQLNTLGVMLNVQNWRRPIEKQGGGLHFFDKTQNTNRFGAVPSFFASTDFGVKNLSVGLGAYVPFGAELEFPSEGSQRYIVTKTNLRNFYITPTVSYRLNNGLSFGVGLSYIYSTFEMRQANSLLLGLGGPSQINNPDPKYDGVNALQGKDTASFGANLGIQYVDKSERYALGVSAMLPTNIDIRGPAFFKNAGLEGPKQLGKEFEGKVKKGERDDSFGLRFKNPLVLRAGFMVRPIEQLRVTMDVNFQRWSTSRSLDIDFENNWPMTSIRGSTIFDIQQPLKWKNTFSFRTGVEAQPKADLPLLLRVGGMYDQSPVQDAYFDLLVPDSDKFGLSGGVGYSLHVAKKVQMSLDLAYAHFFLKERNIAPIKIGADTNSGNDDNKVRFDDTAKNEAQITVPGSHKTILNQQAPSYHYGVTRGHANLLGLSLNVRI